MSSLVRDHRHPSNQQGESGSGLTQEVKRQSCVGDRGPRLSRGSLLIGLDVPAGWGTAGDGRAEQP